MRRSAGSSPLSTGRYAGCFVFGVAMGALRIGCSGWNYPHWRGRVYPAGLPCRRWLAWYATRFDTVEVNATFYRLASVRAVAEWVATTPPGFLFVVKASRFLTHMKKLTDLGAGVARFYDRLQPMIEAGRLGPVLWQLPDRFARDDDRLADALRSLPPGRHAFELRHPSWFVPAVFDLLRRHDAALVVGDHPQRRFQPLVRTATWSYLRFHYGVGGRRGNYGPRELATWAARIAAWRDGDVYAYFNNDWEGFAVRNALALRTLLTAGGRPVAADAEAAQRAGGRYTRAR